ncbi:MAG: hypothetical protein IJI75_03460 [Solobacterium sp.]|nr:hypothetical protein [Solobacterium sp.]
MFLLLTMLVCGGGLIGLGMANEYYYSSGMNKYFLPPSTWSDDTDLYGNSGGCSSCYSSYNDDDNNGGYGSLF